MSRASGEFSVETESGRSHLLILTKPNLGKGATDKAISCRGWDSDSNTQHLWQSSAVFWAGAPVVKEPGEALELVSWPSTVCPLKQNQNVTMTYCISVTALTHNNNMGKWQDRRRLTPELMNGNLATTGPPRDSALKKVPFCWLWSLPMGDGLSSFCDRELGCTVYEGCTGGSFCAGMVPCTRIRSEKDTFVVGKIREWGWEFHI